MFWMIVGGAKEDGASPLGVDLPGEGEGALAVFSFEEEEAQAYLRLGAPEGGHWRVEEVGPKELLVSMFSGACSRVRWVALDPMPEVSGRLAVALVGVGREGFLELLSARASPGTPAAGEGAGIEPEKAGWRG